MKSCSFVLLIRSFVIVASVDFEFKFGCYIMNDTSIFIRNIVLLYLNSFLSFFLKKKSDLLYFGIRGFCWKKILFDCSLLRCKYFHINFKSLSRLKQHTHKHTISSRSFCSEILSVFNICRFKESTIFLTQFLLIR